MSIRSLLRTTSRVLLATALAGCAQDATEPGRPAADIVPFPSSPASLEWQELARNLVATNRLSAPASARVYAALGVAQHRAIQTVDALPSVDGALPELGFDAGGRARFEARRGAVAGASARVLGFFFAGATAALEQKVAEQGVAGRGPVHPEFTRAVAAGRTAGDALIAHVKNDGFTKPWTGTVPVGPGMWVPNSLPPAGGTLGEVTPYFLASGSQFRPAPPPAFGSTAFNDDVDEVLTTTQNLTPAQLAIAQFWDFPGGTPTPIGYWNSRAAQYVAAAGLDERAATRVFALMHAAVFDALIGCWDAKYYYWTLRPSQANPAISLAMPLPNFPSYPSGHSCASASAARVLTHFFPGAAVELAALVEEAGAARIYGGIHFRFDVTAGQQLGSAVADWALAHHTF